MKLTFVLASLISCSAYAGSADFDAYMNSNARSPALARKPVGHQDAFAPAGNYSKANDPVVTDHKSTMFKVSGSDSKPFGASASSSTSGGLSSGIAQSIPSSSSASGSSTSGSSYGTAGVNSGTSTGNSGSGSASYSSSGGATGAGNTSGSGYYGGAVGAHVGAANRQANQIYGNAIGTSQADIDKQNAQSGSQGFMGVPTGR